MTEMVDAIDDRCDSLSDLPSRENLEATQNHSLNLQTVVLGASPTGVAKVA